MASRRERRRRRANRPVAATSHAAPTSRPWWQWPLTVLVILGIVGYSTAAVLAGDQIRDAFQWVPCRLTTCAAPAMAAGGWLVPTTLLASAVTAWLLWDRLGTAGRVAVVLASVAIGGVTWLFVPPGTTAGWIGPGGGAFATGLRWGLTGIAAALVAVTALSAQRLDLPERTQRRWRPVVAAGCALLALGVALARAENRPMTAAEVFPGPFRVDSHRFTPVSATDRDGCAGVVANPPLLRGCLRTAESVVTDEDGTRITLAAVLFASRSEARARWQDLPAGTGPQGVTGPAVSVADFAGGWLLLATAAGPGGAAAANRVMVQFQRRQGDTEARYRG